MAINFASIVGNLQSLGFYDFVLPWLLFFAVILGLLNATGVFGNAKEAGRINAIIAAVVSFFAVAFTPAGITLAAYLTTIFGAGGMIVAVLLLIVILGGVLGYKPNDFLSKGEGDKAVPIGWAKPLIGLVIVILAALVFGGTTGTGIALPGLDSDTWTLILILVFVLLVIAYASGGKKAE